MEIRAEEISEIIKKQIKGYGKEVEVSETGTIISVGDVFLSNSLVVGNGAAGGEDAI